MEKLTPDPASADEVIGFHAQQAVEKLLKAVLSAKAIRYRRTHDLVELIDLLRDSGIALPTELEAVRRLTPFAIEYRYEDLPPDPEPLDRTWALDLVRRATTWAESAARETVE